MKSTVLEHFRNVYDDTKIRGFSCMIQRLKGHTKRQKGGWIMDQYIPVTDIIAREISGLARKPDCRSRGACRGVILQEGRWFLPGHRQENMKRSS